VTFAVDAISFLRRRLLVPIVVGLGILPLQVEPSHIIMQMGNAGQWIKFWYRNFVY